MLYQTQHSVIADKVTLERGEDLTFPSHIHNSFEIIIATEGEMEVTVVGKKYTILGNECILVFPNQIHEIKTEKYSKHMILIFSPQLVRAFSKRFEISRFWRNYFSRTAIAKPISVSKSVVPTW